MEGFNFYYLRTLFPELTPEQLALFAKKLNDLSNRLILIESSDYFSASGARHTPLIDYANSPDYARYNLYRLNYGSTPNDIFMTFDSNPASASLANVFHIKFKWIDAGDVREVAIVDASNAHLWRLVLVPGTWLDFYITVRRGASSSMYNGLTTNYKLLDSKGQLYAPVPVPMNIYGWGLNILGASYSNASVALRCFVELETMQVEGWYLKNVPAPRAK